MKRFFSLILVILMIFAYSPIYASAKNKDKNSEDLTAVNSVNIEWWKEFNDPILTDYIIKAIQYNNDLKISTLKTEEAKQTKNIVRADEMPTLGVGAVPALYKLPTLTQSHGFISLPLYANYEVDLFGKNRDKTKAMDKIYEISKLNEKSAYISVVSAVGSVYFNTVKLDELIAIQEQIVQDRKKIYDLMKLSNEEGLISTADTVNANKAYLKATNDLYELQKTRERLLNSLAVLTGENPNNTNDFKRISYEDINLTKQIPDSVSSEIIQSRPDYMAAEKLVEKSGIDVRVAKKEFLPTIDILGMLSFNSSDLFLKKMNWTNASAILGAGVALPLFTGGKKIANLKLKKNQYEQVLEKYQKTNLTSIQEVNDSLSDLKLDTEKYNKTLESLKAEEQSFYYTNLKYKEGVISNLDLLQNRETLFVTRKAAANDKINCFIDQISLYKAVGGQNIN